MAQIIYGHGRGMMPTDQFVAAMRKCMDSKPEPLIRKFDTGATRNIDVNKYDYEAFLSPAVLERFAEYMHSNRKQADGSYRDGDNWQKGIPLDAYMKSSWRHFMDLWKLHRGLPAAETIEMACCALMFNIMGYLHEHLKAKEEFNTNKENPQIEQEITIPGRRCY